MRNYFNTPEQSHHLIIMTAMVSVNALIESSAPTDEEKKMLKKAKKLISDFSESVFERLGESHRKSLKNKASLNTLRLVARNTSFTKSSQMEDFIDREYLVKLLDLSADIDCEGCERTDCKNCNIYKMKDYLNYNGKSEDNDLCPFRKEKVGIDNMNFDFDDLESDSK